MIDKNKIRISDYICERLIKCGLSKTFMITGGGSMHLNDALTRSRIIDVHFLHHEQSLSMAAEGFSRVTGKPAIVNVTTGPGVINTLNGVYGAFVDSVPMFVISGQVKTETIAYLKNRKLRQLGDQEVDTYSMVKPIVKYYAMPTSSEECIIAIERAIHHLNFGRSGPVWIDIPNDIQAKTIEKSLISKILIKNKNLKMQDFIHKNQKQMQKPKNNFVTDIEIIIKKIKKAKRPIILAGNGVRISGQQNSFLRVLNKLKIPAVTGWNAHDILPNNHYCYAGKPGTIGDRAGNFSIENSDCLIVLGCRLNIRQISYNWKSFANDKELIMVDIDPSEINKHTLRVNYSLTCDLKYFFPKFEKKIKDWETNTSHYQYLKFCKKIVKKYPILSIKKKNKNNINPYDFFSKLYHFSTKDDTLVLGNGTACVIGLQSAIIKKGLRVFTNSGAASMGYDLPAAIGASLSKKGNKRVICISGDGSIMMNIQELASINYKQLPIKIFILDNNGYHSIRETQKNFFNDNISGTNKNDGLGFPNFIKIGQAFGIKSRVIRRFHDLDKIFVNNTFLDNTPQIYLIKIDETQNFEPKLRSRKLQNGSMVTPKLYDMWPFLPRKELKSNLIFRNM